eukprot:362478-Chlamydomonas_euryale.AAC.14
MRTPSRLCACTSLRWSLSAHWQLSPSALTAVSQRIGGCPKRALATGQKRALAAGPKQALAAGPKQALAAGPKQALAAGPKQALATGPKQALAAGPKHALAAVPKHMLVAVPICAFLAVPKRTQPLNSELSLFSHPPQVTCQSMRLPRMLKGTHGAEVPSSRQQPRRPKRLPLPLAQQSEQWHPGWLERQHQHRRRQKRQHQQRAQPQQSFLQQQLQQRWQRQPQRALRLQAEPPRQRTPPRRRRPCRRRAPAPPTSEERPRCGSVSPGPRGPGRLGSTGGGQRRPQRTRGR